MFVRKQLHVSSATRAIHLAIFGDWKINNPSTSSVDAAKFAGGMERRKGSPNRQSRREESSSNAYLPRIQGERQPSQDLKESTPAKPGVMQHFHQVDVQDYRLERVATAIVTANALI